MYRCLDTSMVRLGAHGRELIDLGWPDLETDGSTDEPTAEATEAVEATAGARCVCGAGGLVPRRWLRAVWAQPDFAGAVADASPVLAREVETVLSTGLRPRDTRRVARAVLRYLLRATSRATPFGFFAGVAPARVGEHAHFRLGDHHQVTERRDVGDLPAILALLSQTPPLRDALLVQRNGLAVVHGERLLLSIATGLEAGKQVSVRHTRPVETVLRHARTPSTLAGLRAAVVDDLDELVHPSTSEVLITRVDGLLDELLRIGFLVSELTPRTTATSPPRHVLDVLDRLAATCQTVSSAPIRSRLDLAQATARQGKALGVDLCVNAEMTVPPAVLDEAAAAATALAWLAAPAPNAAWGTYHRRFLDRFGLGALVPLSDLLHHAAGLGYPSGDRSGDAAAPDPERARGDGALLDLAFRAARDRHIEVSLDDADLARLGCEPTGARQPHADLRVEVHAASRDAVDRGEFELLVVGVSRAAGTVTGRFLDLLPAADRGRVADGYRELPTTSFGARRVQLHGDPLNPAAALIARAPLVLADDLVVGPTMAGTVDLADIAVSADANGLYLLTSADPERAEPVEPLLLSAIELVGSAHPTLRFLAEISHAHTSPLRPFTWGKQAATLPFLPRLRYRRTVLSPARWRLTSADVEQDPDPLRPWRSRWDVPDRVVLVEHDRRLALDLTVPAHRHLLQHTLGRRGHVVLTEAPHPQAYGWTGNRPHELVLTVATTHDHPSPTRPRPTAARSGTSTGAHRPGLGQWASVELPCRRDDQAALLVEHLPELFTRDPALAERDWWFIRHTDPEHHLRLRVRCAGPDDHAVLLVSIGRWADELISRGLLGPPRLVTYYPEAGRFGDAEALRAAESVFVADSAAAAAQLATADEHQAALTATSMVDLADALLDGEGTAWLLDHAPRRGPALDVASRARAVALVAGDHRPAPPSTDGDHHGTAMWAGAWARRRAALGAYRATLVEREIDPGVVLPDLLHLHHARAVGLDLDDERLTLRLARAAALSRLHRRCA